MNACVVPSAIDGFVGVTSIEVRVAALIVRVVEALIPLAGSTAVIVVEPTAMLAAKPSLPKALLAVATFVLDEFQVSWLVKSCVELSLYMPIAVNCRAVPRAITGLTGVTEIEVGTAALTLSVVESLIPLVESAAVMVAEPTEVPVARPLLPAALLAVATAMLDELQVTELVRSCVE